MTVSRDAEAKEAEAEPGESEPRAAVGIDMGEPTHREILQVLSGLLLALFVANVSGTIVSNALPTITAALGSTQQQYTWFVTAALLASTATTPIWGKLADLFNKKALMLVGLGVFTLGSALSGAAPTTMWLIAARAVQGIGLGANQALVQAILGAVIPPRRRGRYMAYTGATMAVATVVGPLVGGFIVDTPGLGWRWCFYSAIPFTLLAMVVLQWRLKVPTLRRAGAKVDWAGASLITLAVSSLLIWISFADHEFAYGSWQTAAMLSIFAAAAIAFVIVERHVAEPMISMRILSSRTTALAVAASIPVGTAMFGATVFLGQYYQLGRGYSPTVSGLMMAPMMFGVMLSSVFVGRLVSKVGVWKPFVVTGTAILAAGACLLATIRHDTPLPLIGVYMTIAGLGLGMTMQNLVLAVQNTVDRTDIGQASATVTFFRSLGGAIGIQLLGTVFSHRVKSLATTRLAEAHVPVSDAATGAGALDFSALPAPAEAALRSSYGDAVSVVFAIAAGLALLALVAVAFMRGTRLRDTWAPAEQVAKALDNRATLGASDEAPDAAAPVSRTPAGEPVSALSASSAPDALGGLDDIGQEHGPGHRSDAARIG